MLLSALRRRFGVHRVRVVARRYATPDALRLFRDAAPLPTRWGVGFDERCVEYPWTFAHLPAEPSRVLDAGSVLNYAPVLAHPAVAPHALHVLTLAPEDRAYWQRGVSYLYADLRDIPARTGYYDTAVCLSTLEHVGCDNSDYGGAAERADPDEAAAAAMRELRRVLRPGGSLLLTVPYGVPTHLGWLRVFDRHALVRACEAFRPVTRPEVTFYQYGREGWQLGTPESAGGLHYAAPPHDGGWDGDGARFARAVACVRLVA